MDVFQALRELYEEKKRLDSAISALEARHRLLADSTGSAIGRRGRKSMSAEERQEVSRRMSRYWANRRNAPQVTQIAAPAEAAGVPIERIQGAA